METLFTFFFNPIVTPIIILLIHFYGKPTYSIIHGKIDSVNKDTVTGTGKISGMTHVVFKGHANGERKLIKYLLVKSELGKYIWNYNKTTLSGYFLIRKQFGFNTLFAYSNERDLKVACLHDMTTPYGIFKKSLWCIAIFLVMYMNLSFFYNENYPFLISDLIIFAPIIFRPSHKMLNKVYWSLWLLLMLYMVLMRIPFLLNHDFSFDFRDYIMLLFPITLFSVYLFWRNVISKYKIKQFHKECKLLKQIGIPEPLLS